jgi:hypothetical protein
VLRFHDSAVSAVLLLNDGCITSSSEDGRIAIWKKDKSSRQACSRVIRPVVALAQSPDARLLGSAS